MNVEIRNQCSIIWKIDRKVVTLRQINAKLLIYGFDIE